LSDILKIVCHTGTVSEIVFDHNEVRDMVIKTKQDYSIKNLQNRKPLLYLTSGEYRTFTITINTYYFETITKLNTLKLQTLPVTLFYDFKNVPGSSACVMLDLKIPNYYSMGLQAANKEIKLTFYEVQPSLDYITIPESNIVCATPNYAVHLNGIDQYLYRTHEAAYNLAAEDIILSVWFKTTGTEEWIFSKKKTGQEGYGLYVNEDGILVLIDGVGAESSSGLTVNDGTGKYISVAIDKSSLTCYWFLNGAFAISSGLASAFIDNTVDFVVGAQRTTGDTTGASGFFSGEIDDLRIMKCGVNGLYITGTFGASGIIRAGTSTGDLIWSDTAPTNSLVRKLYTEGFDTLTGMGFPSIDNANQTNKFTNPDNEAAYANWGGTDPTATRGSISRANDIADHTSGSGYSIKFTGDGASTGQKRINWQKASFLTLDKWYKATCWVFIPATNTVLNSVGFRYTIISPAITYSGTITTTLGSWVKLSLVFKGGVSASDYFYVYYTAFTVTSESFYVDDLTLEEIGEVARWRMEQSLLDESANNLDLTGVGTPTYTPHID